MTSIHECGTATKINANKEKLPMSRRINFKICSVFKVENLISKGTFLNHR
jgi:hypothetical protein